MPTLKVCALCKRLNGYAEKSKDKICFRCKIKQKQVRPDTADNKVNTVPQKE